MPLRLVIVASLALLSGCATIERPAGRFCESAAFRVDGRFEGGNFHRCEFSAADRVVITIRKEDPDVTIEQPWFAFRVTADPPDDIDIELRFPQAYARYWPKVSTDGIRWQRLDDSAVSIADSGKNMRLTVPVSEAGIWVSAQELLTLAFYRDWLAELEAHEEIETAVIGESVEGRPIHMARTAHKAEVLLLFGRQHPAEVPGALAMRTFADTILAYTQLAREFRERFTLLIVPLVNPDGVVNGHWRHNAGRTDLNRDWGPFTQPETQSIARLLAGLDWLNMRPRLMLDFHATKFTDSVLLYTQRAEDLTDPVGFASAWLGRVRERIPDYAFTHDPRPTSEQPNTKGYFYLRYGIPAFTYEIGDEADRDRLRDATPVFAEEMMRTLLEAERPD